MSEDACKGWVEHYGHLYREVRACGKVLSRRKIGLTDIQACRATMQRAAAHPDAVAIISSCVTRGRSYGVTQRRRR